MARIHFAVRSALVGALLLLFSVPAAWACSGLTSISPTSGPAGTVVTLTGSGFSPLCPGLYKVTFGGNAGTSLNVINDTTATVVVPAGSGTVDVTAYIDSSQYTLYGAFTYTAGTDSQNLQTSLDSVSNTVANTSGEAITGSVDGAIGGAFSGGGSGGSGGGALNYAGTPPKSGAQIAADALAGATDKASAPAAWSRLVQEWSLWADVRGSGFNSDDAFGTHGGQMNLTAGLGRKLTPDLLIGLIGGYETFDYKTDSVGGKVSGNGGTIGGYAAVRFADSWRADAMLGWSAIHYDAATSAASGSTNGSRWLASSGLTGSYRFDNAVFEPTARITALWEHQAAWTDSLGFTQAARDFSVGRLSAGGRLVFPWPSSVARISTYLGLFGDYRFSSDDALPAGVTDVGVKDGVSARVTAGITATMPSGLALSLGGEFGGIGGGYGLWSANARAALPF